MPKPLCIRDILAKTESYFRDKQVDSPRLSAQLMVSKGLGMDRMGLFLDLDRPLTEPELAQVRPLVVRRGKGEPVAYILGNKEFFGLDFLSLRTCSSPGPKPNSSSNRPRPSSPRTRPWPSPTWAPALAAWP